MGTNIGEDQLVAIAERAIVEAKQNLDGPQVNFRTLSFDNIEPKKEPGLGFDDFSSAMKSTEIEAKMSVRFHD